MAVNVEKETIDIAGKEFTGIKIMMGETPVLMIAGEKSFLLCGYFNMEAAEKFGHVACSVTGVKSFAEMLEASVSKASSRARKKGAKEGMTGEEALIKMET